MKNHRRLLISTCALVLAAAFYWLNYGRHHVTPVPVVDASASIGDYHATRRLDALFPDDPARQRGFDTWAKGAVSNGLLCAVSSLRRQGEHEPLPEAAIYVVNLRTNRAYPCMQLPPQALFKIKLFDSNGIAVKRTVEGENYVDWTDKQCVDWYSDICANKRGNWSFMVLPPPDCTTHVGWINLQHLFEIKELGDYTFHVSLPVIELKTNATGGVDHFEKTILPEAIAKVQILPEDIKAAAKYWKTNAPSR